MLAEISNLDLRCREYAGEATDCLTTAEDFATAAGA